MGWECGMAPSSFPIPHSRSLFAVRAHVFHLVPEGERRRVAGFRPSPGKARQKVKLQAVRGRNRCSDDDLSYALEIAWLSDGIPKPRPASSRLGPASSRLGPASSSLGPASSRLGPASSSLGPASSRLGPASSRLGPASSRLGPASSRLGPASSRLGPVSSSLGPVSSRLGPASSRLDLAYCPLPIIFRGGRDTCLLAAS
jgi:hypothetical protein